jgi:hypothetical protein
MILIIKDNIKNRLKFHKFKEAPIFLLDLPDPDYLISVFVN